MFFQKAAWTEPVQSMPRNGKARTQNRVACGREYKTGHATVTTRSPEKQNLKSNGSPYSSDSQPCHHATLFNTVLTRRRNETACHGEIREHCEDTDISLYINTLYKIRHQYKFSCLPVTPVLPSGKASSRQWKRLFRTMKKPFPSTGTHRSASSQAPFRRPIKPVPHDGTPVYTFSSRFPDHIKQRISMSYNL